MELQAKVWFLESLNEARGESPRKCCLVGESCLGIGCPELEPAVAGHGLEQPRASGLGVRATVCPESQRRGGAGFPSPGLPQQVVLKVI